MLIIIRKNKINLFKQTFDQLFIYQKYQMTEAVTLIGNRICPFAQRVWLTLLEKQVPFTFKEASLSKKEAWFTQTYHKAFGHEPTSDGMVPILIHGQKTIAESDLLSWYVAETFPTGTELIPSDTFQRLKMRRFIQQIPGKLVGAFYSTSGYQYKDQAEKAETNEKILKNLRIVESEIEGPFVLGDTFSLADILLYPWFQRWFVIEKYFGIRIPEELTKIRAFISAVQARPSVKEALSKVSDDFYLDGYATYLK